MFFLAVFVELSAVLCIVLEMPDVDTLAFCGHLSGPEQCDVLTS